MRTVLCAVALVSSLLPATALAGPPKPGKCASAATPAGSGGEAWVLGGLGLALALRARARRAADRAPSKEGPA